MVPICLSLAPILRCETLTRLESGIILLPPALEIIFCLGLLWAKRGSNRKHTFLAAEGFVYFCLALLDLITHVVRAIGTSMDTFRSLDIVVGAASSIPIFLYTFFLFLFTNSELIPTLPQRLQKFAKYILLLFIPLIVASNELGSFVSISYRTLVGVGKSSTLVVGFTNELVQTFFDSLTLVLLTAFQAMIFCIAFFRLYRALSHQRNIEEAPRSEVEAYLFRGLGWIVVGMKVGAIETVVGFAQGGFTVALIRRILRLLGRGCLIIGILKGVDTVEGFQMYSPTQNRRRSALRAMITNPRFSTFRHVGGQNFDTESAFADREATYEKRDSGISLSPRRIARESKYISFQIPVRRGADAAPPSSLASPAMSPGSSVRSSTRSSSAWSSFRSSVMVVRNIITRPYDPNRTPASASSPTEKDTENVPPVPAIPSTPLGSPGLRARPRSPIKARTLRQRVTVHMSKGSAPVLELHRFSALNLDPFRDPLGVRATSLPVNLDELQRTKIRRLSASFTPLPTLPPAFIPAVNSPSMSRPTSVLDINSPSSATYVGSPMSLLNSAGTVTSFASRAGTERHTIAIVDVRPTSALSSMTTASDMRALTIQFPGIPPPRRPRSMLSREITRQDVAVPMPADASALVRRGSSVKRKPVPPFYATPAEEEARGEYAYRVVDERQAAASLPTPISMTESPIRSRPKRRVLRRRATSDSKRSRARSLSVGESSMQRNVEEDRGFVGVEEDVTRVASKVGGHTRARSVGSAPRRMTSSRRATQPRDSLLVKRDLAKLGESTAADSGSSVLRRQVEAIDVVRQSVFA